MSTKPVEMPAGLDKLVETLAPERPILTTHKAPKFRLLARLPSRRPPPKVERPDSSRSGSSSSGESTEGAENKAQEVSVPKRKNSGDEVEIVREIVTVHRRVVRWTLTVVDDGEPNKRQKIDSEESESEDDSEDESDSCMQSVREL